MTQPTIVPMKTIANTMPHLSTFVEHILLLPALCPASNNPKVGSSLTIQYAAGSRILELFSLDKHIASYIGHPVVRDMEYFAQVVAQNAADTLGYPVTLIGEFSYHQVNQRQKVTIQALPQAVKPESETALADNVPHGAGE